MRIALDDLIDGLEHQLPDIRRHEIHLFVIEQREWLNRLLHHICAQQKLLFIVEDIDIAMQARDSIECSTGSHSAEWKRKTHYTHKGIGRTLASLGDKYDVLCMHFNCAKPSALFNYMFNQDGLLTVRRWARNQGKIVLFFVDGDQNSDIVRQLLTANACHCHSLSSIYQGDLFWRWDVHHWFDGSRIIQPKLRLQEYHESQFKLIHDKASADENYALLKEQAPVYYVNGALDGNEVAPIEWTMLDQTDDWFEHVRAFSDDAIILGYYRGQTIQVLLRTVYDLRKTRGPHIRIYIRERDQAIRHQDERLLTQAGVTLVLPFGLRFSQVVSLVENSTDWRFNRPLPEQFELLQEQLVPQNLQGYLPLHEFAEQSMWLAQLAERQGVDYSLIKAQPSTGLTCVEILKSFKHRREGDLSSSDGRFVYLFLFACRAADVDRALTFLFGLPAQALLNNEERLHSIYLVEELKRQLLQRSNPPDYSVILEELRNSPEHHKEAYDRYFPQPKQAKPAKL